VSTVLRRAGNDTPADAPPDAAALATESPGTLGVTQ
jgi:hypothetical protein